MSRRRTEVDRYVGVVCPVKRRARGGMADDSHHQQEEPQVVDASPVLPGRFQALASQGAPRTRPRQHPMFATSSNAIGYLPMSKVGRPGGPCRMAAVALTRGPPKETMPTRYVPKSNTFSKQFNFMYRNYSLNTSMN